MTINIVGVATVSVGLITAACYLLLSLSRYFGRVFSKKNETDDKEKKSDALLENREDGVANGATHSETKTNGVVPHLTNSEYDSPSHESSLNGVRVGLGVNGTVPNGFERFVGDDMIVKFEKQRQVKFQFFVVVLASEDDLKNLGGLTFHPHDTSSPRLPLVDNQKLTMPSATEYGNYIVARFESCEYHSEEVVFGPKYNNPFSQLWSAYTNRNGGNRPKAVLMYSWNFPCGRCTKLITKILGEERYSGTSVMLAYSRVWDSEDGYPHVAGKNMSSMRKQIHAHIQQVEPPSPLQEAGSTPTT